MLSLVEAAQSSGFSVELIERLLRSCPKSGENRTLAHIMVGGTPMIDEKELDSYRRYLRAPWPLTPRGTRPNMPDYIKEDVSAESHYQCAICGSMDNGEIAHIDPASTSLNNSPDNLILLCPNHHTKYDLGFKPASNVSREVILAAKEMKRASRRRVLRFEGNAVLAMRTVLRIIEQVEKNAKDTQDEMLRQAYTTEIGSLISHFPDVLATATDAATKDQPFTDADKSLLSIAPNLARVARDAISPTKTETQIRSVAQRLIGVSESVLDLDEVDCPHCGGSGQTGLVGDICNFCRGSCHVTHARATAYAQRTGPRFGSLG